ncbi:phosphotransferase enzyme family protein [Methylomagnum ishizawai]|uniref:phosphotransferase enzyme family protein n=1 Tax=Methylomagnum ishizawai TaxID=1760988 RepID=UPI001C33E7D9|nr:phosphotransferase [Methylomagnum ishizawai]BBL73365.1 homoserine/choline kinase [Methylomagnum ishizawai]
MTPSPCGPAATPPDLGSPPFQAAARFASEPIATVEPLGRGLINATFLVTTATRRFVLQRINARVFPDPVAIMANLRILTDHLRSPATRVPAPALRLPGILATLDGADFHRDGTGEYWRALDYIEDSRTLARLDHPAQAEAVGRALGRFHVLAGGIDPASMRDTLPGFHIAPQYLARFDAIAARPRPADGAALRAALDFVAARRDGLGVLEQAKRRGELVPRIVHGDPKLDNVLFDPTGGHAVGLVDLDTVKPGLIHYDLGDCLRSCCNRQGECEHGGPARFDLDFCRAILKGYGAEARALLGPADRAYLYHAIRLLPLELGLRFLTDHLNGDVYFRVDAPGQNLERARAQFRLAESVERQETEIRDLIAGLA